ncbi:MAG: EamA family transporter [Nocardioides sp.]
MTDDNSAGPNATAAPVVGSVVGRASGRRHGLGVALVSAISFGMSGAIAKPMIESGWSAGAAVTARVALATVVLMIPALLSLRGRWGLLRAHLGSIVAFGVVAVAGAQLSYFNAVARMDVAMALLIEYLGPILVVLWLWLRHGQRPTLVVVGGAAVALAGMAIMLGLPADLSADLQGTRATTGTVDPVGLLWALGAMVGLAAYFILSASRAEEVDGDGLPPLVLAAAGLAIGAVVLMAAGVTGLLPFDVSGADVSYAGSTLPWAVPAVALGVFAGALPYATGIAAVRSLGSRLASFVGLFEVVAAAGFAWLLIGERPGLTQLIGGVLILAGVIVVRLGDR